MLSPLDEMPFSLSLSVEALSTSSTFQTPTAILSCSPLCVSNNTCLLCV